MLIRNHRGDVGGVGEGTTVLSTCVSTERPTILTGQVDCDFVSSVTFLCVCDLVSPQRGPPYLQDTNHFTKANEIGGSVKRANKRQINKNDRPIQKMWFPSYMEAIEFRSFFSFLHFFYFTALL